MREKLKKEETGFAQIKNELLSDADLSLKAKGLYAYLYSKPDDWDFSSERITLDTKDGIDAVKSGLKELERAGYLVRMRTKTGKVNYCIFCSTKRKKPKVENPTKGKSHKGKIHHISNKEFIQIKKNTNIDDFSDEKFIYEDTNKQTYKSKQAIAYQKGIKLKHTPRTEKQEKTREKLKWLDYYREKAQEIHGMQFFKVKDESRNKAVRKLIIRAEKECELKALIDWWIDGAGEWAQYEPEPCFATKTIERFLNKKNKKLKKQNEGLHW